MNMIRSVCVYCGSSVGNGNAYMEAGRLLGSELAAAGLRLVYGGGSKGVMGAVSDAARQAGGTVTGIIPRFLMNKESSESALSALHETILTDTMHQRKHIMFERSDAFVALPGGIGTLEEIVEIMTWAQLGHHRKPIVFANVNGFWNPMLALLDHMREAGFVHTTHLVAPIVVDELRGIIPAILAAAAKSPVDAEGAEAVIEKM
ncbi:MAG: TIGR00730 family Rossman fold protein [Rhizobiaceae bacterium]|nr:TIGR00730 family Rossman fold protein [Rhizobiaceae bacterium]